MYSRRSVAAPLDPAVTLRQNTSGASRTSAEVAAAQAAVGYTDATEFTETWANLTAWSATGVQVSGNRLYASAASGATSAMRAVNLAANENLHATTIMRWKAGVTAGAFYFGIDTSATGTPTSGSPTGAFIGFGTTGPKSFYVGASFGAAMVDESNIGASPTTDTDYHVTIDVDETWISFSARAIGNYTDIHTIKIPRGSLTLNYLNCFVNDNRFLTGHSFGPVAIVKSLQPVRTKTINATAMEPTHRNITVRSASADPWRIQLPATYDPRIPAPVVVAFHQSLGGDQNTFWSDSRMQATTDALSAAGFIVAAAKDTGDRWGNAASVAAYLDLYKYVRTKFATSHLLFYAVSMGTLTALNALASTTWPTPTAVAAIGGVVNLDLLHANATYTASVRAAYGVAGDGSDYTTKTAGYNPAMKPATDFRGVPFRLYTSTGDTAVTKAGNQDALTTILGTTVPEVTTILGSGGHLDASQFQAADVVTFYKKYL
jgi:hypothetical protein